MLASVPTGASGTALIYGPWVVSSSDPDRAFQLALSSLIDRARELSISLLQRLDSRGQDGSAARVAENVTRALVAATVPLYEAAVQSLVERQTSLAGYGLMRTLIDTWSHLDFIGSGSDRQCRAIRVSLGVQQQAHGALLEGDGVPNQLVEASARRIEIARRQFTELGCSGSSRSVGDVIGSLKDLRAANTSLRWLPEAYRQSSQVLHGWAFDWLLERDAENRLQWRLPTDQERVAWLNHLVITFFGVGDSALQVVGLDEERRSFEDEVMHLLGADLFKAIPQG